MDFFLFFSLKLCHLWIGTKKWSHFLSQLYLRLLYMLEWTGLPLGSAPTYSESRQVPPKSSPCSKTTHSKGESGAVKCLAAASPAGPAPTTATFLPWVLISTAPKNACERAPVFLEKVRRLGHTIEFIDTALKLMHPNRAAYCKFEHIFCSVEWRRRLCVRVYRHVQAEVAEGEILIAGGLIYMRQWISSSKIS